jgi:hypothetical protein
MKKIFTLIAAIAMVASVNAQGLYAISGEYDADTKTVISSEKPDPATPITSVDGITLTYANNGTWKAAKKYNNKADADFGWYTEGNGVNGKFTEGTVPTGCFYSFATTKAGKLTLGVVANAAKSIFVVKQGADEYKPLEASAIKVMATADTELTLGDNANSNGDMVPNSLSEKIYGTISFDVVANETYHVVLTGSKLGFFGFKFAEDVTAIESVTAAKAAKADALYNLAGQRVGKNYKGIVIENGVKKVQK